LAKNEVLQIVVFFAIAARSIDHRSNVILALIDGLVHIMLRVTEYVMRFAPLAAWAAITATVARLGPSVLGPLIILVGSFYLCLGILWLILAAAGFAVIG